MVFYIDCGTPLHVDAGVAVDVGVCSGVVGVGLALAALLYVVGMVGIVRDDDVVDVAGGIDAKWMLKS